MLPDYEIHAIRYASVTRSARAHFLGQDVHDVPARLDYFVWLVRGGNRTILVDTGFNATSGEKRGRTLMVEPVEALARLGVRPEDVDDIVITHLHYDHAGNLDQFPRATFHIQEAEMAYATGPCMCHGLLRHPYDVEDVVTLVRRVYDSRVKFYAGDADLLPGISLHLIPGHTRGQQSVRVNTRRGNVLLASDAVHFLENMDLGNPFPILVDVARTIAGWDRVRALADSRDHIIPGHDPIVTKIYPRLAVEGAEVWCLHEEPERLPENASA